MSGRARRPQGSQAAMAVVGSVHPGAGGVQPSEAGLSLERARAVAAEVGATDGGVGVALAPVSETAAQSALPARVPAVLERDSGRAPAAADAGDVESGVDPLESILAPQTGRPGPLSVVQVSGSARAALDAGTAHVISVWHDAINELRGIAQRAKRKGSLGIAIEANDAVGKLTLHYVDLVLGRKMHVNVNLRTQEDLPDYRARYQRLSPAERATVDASLDLLDAVERGRVLEATRLDDGSS